MQPARRHRILAHVFHRSTLPPGTSATEAQELRGLIFQPHLNHWQLTQAGWRELERQLSELSQP